MKTHIIAFLLFCISTCVGEASVNKEIKRKLQLEIRGMQRDIANASKDIAKLHQDKADVEKALHEMETWGNLQEEAKLQHYQDAAAFEKQAAAASLALQQEEKSNADMLARYHKLKKIMGAIAGSVLVFIYLTYGSKAVSLLLPILGPWGFALRYLGPVAVFGLGYLLILTIF